MNFSADNIVPEGIGACMPTELPTNRVGNGSDKFSSQTEVGTQLSGKLLWAVERVGEVPFKLVIEGNVAHVDIQL